MSEDYTGDSSNDTNQNSSSDAQSPTPSSPILIRSKRRRQVGKESRILPFSSDENVVDNDRPETAVDNQDILEHSDEPVIRGSKKTEDLQIRLFQSKIDMKNIQDELRRRLPGYEDEDDLRDSEIDAPYDESVERSSLGSNATQRQFNNGHTLNRQDTQSWVSSPTHTKLSSENSQSREELDQLRSKLLAFDQLQERNQLKGTESNQQEHQKEASRLKTELKEREEFILKLKETQEFQSRALTAEKSRAVLLHEAKKSLTDEVTRLKQEIAMLREHPSTDTVVQPLASVSDTASSHELIKVKAELERIILQKNQISDMLMDERSLSADLQEALAEYHSEAISKEVSMQASIDESNIKLSTLEVERSTIMNENDEYRHKVQTFEDSVSNLRKSCRELEKRVDQSLAEKTQLTETVTSRKETIERMSRELDERQRRINESSTERDNCNHDLATFDMKIKNLSIAYEGCQSDLSEAHANIENRESKIKTLRNDLKEKRKELESSKDELKRLRETLEAVSQNKQSEIDQLQADLRDDRKTIDMSKEQYQSSIDDITRTHNLNMDQSSKDAKARLSESQSNLSSQLIKLADLKRELLEKSNKINQLIAENKSFKIKTESQEHKVAELESTIQKAESDLYVTNNKLRVASESLKAKTFESKNRSHVEDALSEKVQQLEKMVSDQTLKLNSIANINIVDLQRKAEEGVKALDELETVRREYNNNYAQWVTYHDNSERRSQELMANVGNLESQLSNSQSTESEREEKFRESVRAGHESQLKYSRDEFTYNFNALQSAYESVQNDSTAARSEKEVLAGSLRGTQLRSDESASELSRVQQLSHDAESDHAKLSEQMSQIKSKNDTLNLEIENLNVAIHEFTEKLESREKQINDLQHALTHTQEVANKTARELEDKQQEYIKMSNHFNEISANLFRIMAFSYHQIKSSEFIKKIFSRSFPRFDLIPFASKQPRTPQRSLKVALLTVLAVVRFKDAGKRGTKRQAIISEMRVHEFYQT